MRWRQWIKEPPKQEDLPILLAWNVGGKGTNIEWEMESEDIDPSSYTEPGTFWLPYKDLFETLPKEIPK